MYNVIYSGNMPPVSFDNIIPVETGVGYEELETRWYAGRALSGDFNIIIESGGVRCFFYPVSPPVEE